MTISELIEQAGDKIQWQWLSEAMINAQKTKQGVQITFGTQAVSALELATDTEKYIGMIIWIPKRVSGTFHPTSPVRFLKNSDTR